MPVIPERIDDLYAAAERGEPRVIIMSVSDDIDLLVHPPNEVNTAGLIRLVDADGDVVVWPSEVKRLVAHLVEAAVTLAEWQAQRSAE